MTQTTSIEWDEPLPADERQTPSRFSDEWNNPEWRGRWLGGRTDADIDRMSPAHKGGALPAYVWDSGHETFGPDAWYYAEGKRLLDRASIDPDKLGKNEVIALAKAVFLGERA